MSISRNTRNILLPVAMILGVVFHSHLDRLDFLPPYLIFLILLITFCGTDISRMRVRKLHLMLLGVQFLGGVGIYLILAPFDPVIAQGVMMCVMAPVAMASVVIAVILGADRTTMVTFCLLSNLGIGVLAPIIFPLITTGAGEGFASAAVSIFLRIGPMLLLPFILAWVFRKVLPGFHGWMARAGDANLWLWALSLTIVVGRTVNFIVVQPAGNYRSEIILAAASLVVCLAQFSLGRYLGRRAGDVVAGGQSLGQKNTVLAIWMTQTYLDPLASVGPACYVIWQNLVNSWQLIKSKR